MEYVRNDDVRNLRRLLGRYKDDVNRMCNLPSRTGWSAVTSAADFGHPDVLKYVCQTLYNTEKVNICSSSDMISIQL